MITRVSGWISERSGIVQARRLTRLLDLALCTKSSAQHVSASQQPCAGWCTRPRMEFHMAQIHTSLQMQDSTYNPKGTPAVAPAGVADSDNKSGAAATATPNVALEGQAQPPPNVDPTSMSAQQPEINDIEVSQVGNPRSWPHLALGQPCTDPQSPREYSSRTAVCHTQGCRWCQAMPFNVWTFTEHCLQ